MAADGSTLQVTEKHHVDGTVGAAGWLRSDDDECKFARPDLIRSATDSSKLTVFVLVPSSQVNTCRPLKQTIFPHHTLSNLAEGQRASRAEVGKR